MHRDRQLREIFHFYFLERLLRLSDPKLYVLKGGVNLRFYFNSPRYSEDMDLDVLGGSVETLTKNGYKILQDAAFSRVLNTFGIDSIEINDPTKAKQTKTTQRFRCSLITEAGERLPTKVEFSRRKNEESEWQYSLVNPELARKCKKLSFKCQHYTGHFAYVQKVKALAGRAVTQARDVFDIGVLHAGGYCNNKLAKQFVSRQMLKNAQESTMALSYEDYLGQVIEFLEDEYLEQYSSESDWNNLQELILGLLEYES